MQPRCLKIISSYLLLSIILLLECGCDSNRYRIEAKELLDSITEVLISEKLCRDRSDCYRKQYVFYEAATGVYISAYGIKNAEIKKKIIALCVEKQSYHSNIHYELHMYPQTKDESLKSPLSKRVSLRLIINKEE
jgi:hypothetical protein